MRSSQDQRSLLGVRRLWAEADERPKPDSRQEEKTGRFELKALVQKLDNLSHLGTVTTSKSLDGPVQRECPSSKMEGNDPTSLSATDLIRKSYTAVGSWRKKERGLEPLFQKMFYIRSDG